MVRCRRQIIAYKQEGRIWNQDLNMKGVCGGHGVIGDDIRFQITHLSNRPGSIRVLSRPAAFERNFDGPSCLHFDPDLSAPLPRKRRILNNVERNVGLRTKTGLDRTAFPSGTDVSLVLVGSGRSGLRFDSVSPEMGARTIWNTVRFAL